MIYNNSILTQKLSILGEENQALLLQALLAVDGLGTFRLLRQPDPTTDGIALVKAAPTNTAHLVPTHDVLLGEAALAVKANSLLLLARQENAAISAQSNAE